MNFFCTKKHLVEYQQRMKLQDEDIFCLTLGQGLQVAKMLFAL